MSLFEKLLGVPGAVHPRLPVPRPPRGAPAPGASGLGSFDWRATGLSSFDQGPLVKVEGIPRPTGRAPVNKDICYRVQIPRGARGTTATLEKMAEMAVEASQDPGFVQIARGIVRGCPSRDYVCEGTTIMEHVHEVIPYLNDPAYAEYVQSPGWTYLVEGRGDCFVKGTKVFKRSGMEPVSIESVRAGDEIWGLDRWSVVQNTWDRGVKSTWLVRLNNGSSMRLSPEHKVYVAYCLHFSRGSLSERNCSCPVSERKIERVDLRTLRQHDVVIAPDKVDFGTQEMDPPRAWVEGLYVSDGDSKNNSFRIAGRDGFPREQQKKDVQAICERLGIPTKWRNNYIECYDADWTARMKAMGMLPWNKRALSLDLNEPTAREFLRGVLADSGRNTKGAGRTFSTSSPDLCVQVRVLLKMLGLTASEQFIRDHGSTSEHPIWRLAIRQSPILDGLGTIYDKAWRKNSVQKADPDRKMKLLRVKEIIKDDRETHCFDIATDDHYVWLPEADWTVSNCDDQSCLISAFDLAIGRPCRYAAYKLDRARPDEYSHVLCEMGIRTPEGVRWYGQDSIVPNPTFGWVPPESEWIGPPNYLVLLSA